MLCQSTEETKYLTEKKRGVLLKHKEGRRSVGVMCAHDKSTCVYVCDTTAIRQGRQTELSTTAFTVIPPPKKKREDGAMEHYIKHLSQFWSIPTYCRASENRAHIKEEKKREG